MNMKNPAGLQASDLSPYIYGTTRLGDESIPFADRVAIAREAMVPGMWFHTSDQYGDALKVLCVAFDEDRSSVPETIFKLQGNNVEEIRAQIALHTEALDIDHAGMGQLCMGEPLIRDFAAGGDCLDGFRQLKEEGLVRHLVVEVFPWTSANPLEALRNDYLQGVIDGYIFYLNPLQRFASNELWDLIQEKNINVIAMRTVSGGDVHQLCKSAWKEYLSERAREVAPIFERSDAETWPEFCARLVFGIPQVLATVGATSRLENLQQFRAAVKSPKPLAADIQEKILALQRKWSDETDVHAEPWTM
jgi:hypothetical protein